jgi:sortase A
MRPEDTQQPTSPASPQRELNVPSRDAAVNVVRGQLDALYDTQARHQQQAQTTDQTAQQHPQAEQWKQYHSAWQNYYQQYYERYYTGQLHQAIKHVAATTQPSPQQAQPEPAAKEPEKPKTKDEALFELRQKLVGNARQSAQKVRKSRHFIPITAAFAVVLVFAFLQYNSLLFGTVQAYISPGAIDPQNIIVDPNTDVAVSQDPRLIIPKINVDVPVIYGAKNDHDSMMAAMAKGVAHFAIPGASSVPGQKGNTVFSGHSSNDLFDNGSYKFIFVQLNKLDKGDTIYVNYEGKRYTYVVSSKELVTPTDVNVLLGTNDKPILTLITCWPIGTANQRIILKADQISPDPAQAADSPSSDSSSKGNMPGNGATVLDRLFGNNGN